MPTINFPGGTTAGERDYSLSTSNYLLQPQVVFPLPADGVRRNLYGNYAVRAYSIIPAGFLLDDIGPNLNYGGINYGENNIITFSELTYGFCEIRIYSSATPYTFYGVGNSTSNGFQERSVATDQLIGSSNESLAGTWTWTTVPTAPSVSTVLNGTNVTVTRGNSTTDSEETILGYSLQRRESTNGSTWGSWGNEIALSTTTFSYTYTGLTPGKYYQFRVYASNGAGFSEATVSGLILIPSITRYTGTAFIAPDNLKRYDGSAWQNITQVKRWNGTSWVTVDITGVNSVFSIGF